MKIQAKSERLVKRLVLKDVLGTPYPDNTPFCLELDNKTPLECQYSFVCSLQKDGSLIVVHEPEPELERHIHATFRDMETCMGYALDLATEIVDYTSDKPQPRRVKLKDKKEICFIEVQP